MNIAQFRLNHAGIRTATTAARAILIGGLLLGAAGGGCATRRAPVDTPNRPASAAGTSAASPLRTGPSYQALRAAAREPGRPVADAPLPEGLDPAAVAPIVPGTPEHARAVEPLDTVRDRLVRDATPTASPAARADPDSRIAALRRYAAGRQKLLEGHAREAAEELSAATQLDPGSPEPWRELGDAQAAAGSLIEAESSYQAALDRGLRDARVYEFLGRAALTAGEPERAAGLLFLAAAADPGSADPSLPLVIASGLGQSLLAAGYLEVGSEVLVRSLQLPARPPSPTHYANELGTLYRRQGDAWREAGDAATRLGRFDRALEAYLRSAELPAMEAVDLPARVLFAAERAGRPAAAALFVIDRIVAAGGRASRDDIGILRRLSRDPAVGRLAARAVDELAASAPEGSPPSVFGGLARARAAAAPVSDAVPALREHLRRFPGDALSATELLLVAPDRTAEATRLTGAAPQHAERYADALIRATPDIPGALAALDARREGAARLLAVFVAARIHRQEQAWSRVEGFTPSGALGRETDAVRARLAAARGRWADADVALARLASLPRTPDAARALARALWGARRADEALGALAPAWADPRASTATRLDDLLLGAELAQRLGRVDDAEARLAEAVAIDPGDDRPYALLLAQHGPSGPRPDTERLAASLRELRDASPDSRLLAFIRSQEFLRRGFFTQAERELKRLAEPDPTDPAALELLCAIWTRPGQRAESEELAAALHFLDDAIRLRPWSDTLFSARVRVLAAAGRQTEAEAALRTRLGRAGPDAGGPELARMLESLLRRRGQTDEADRLALARLSGPDRSIDETIEFIELLAGQARDAEAADALRAGLPARAVLDAGQTERLQAVLVTIVGRAARDRAVPRGPALSILDAAIARRVRLAPEVHDQRLALLAAEPGVDADRLIAAADDAARDYPSLGAAAYLRLSQALVAADRTAEALALMERAGARDDAGLDVLEAWVRFVATAGHVDNARHVLDRAAALGQARRLLERLLPNRPSDEPGTEDPRAVLAYELALNWAAQDREDDAIALYELALEYDPKHGWANNNLGYHFVERGEHLDRAERLLEAAIEALPDDGSVIDSLGWLRYRLGVLQDVTDEAGRVVKPGAVSLLRHAVRTDKGVSNQTIIDHYGDALWAAGQKSDARRQWERADRAAGQRARELAALDSGTPGRDRLLREANEVRASVQRKIQAVVRGEEPPIAPRAPAPPPAAQVETPGG